MTVLEERMLMRSKANKTEGDPSAVAGGTDVASRDEVVAAVRVGLDAIPPKGRGSDWLKASVLVNCLFRHAGSDTFRQLQELKAKSEQFEFDEFVSKVFAVLHPHTLSPHGYHKSMGSRDSASGWKSVAEIGAMLEELGYEWFINSGTLLGAIRDNDFIPHDDDVDLSVVVPGNDIETVVRSWFILKGAIRRRKMLVPWNDTNQFHFKVKANFGVDVFPCWIIDDRVFIWPHTSGEMGTNELLPLSLRRMGPVTVKVPAMPERLLEQNYGADWRTPDPAWRFDWRRAWNKFAAFRAIYNAARSSENAS